MNNSTLGGNYYAYNLNNLTPEITRRLRLVSFSQTDVPVAWIDLLGTFYHCYSYLHKNWYGNPRFSDNQYYSILPRPICRAVAR
jgi:hypothetical protein